MCLEAVLHLLAMVRLVGDLLRLENRKRIEHLLMQRDLE